MNINNIATLNSAILPFSIGWRFNFKLLRILGALSIILLLSFYIFQVQEVTKTSFNISTYEKKIAELSQENKNLEIDFSRVNSPANLENLLKNSQYELVIKIHYIQISENQVVVKPR